jgi:APA family basic amino acid/polyamine antiporter
LGLFDATMIVMGGIIGAGIFINPSIVARHAQTPLLVLLAWLIGGLIALAGAFVYAELAARRPEVGGQYAYLREAYHPLVAFLYGWALLLVIQTGGMAAVAVTFARYFVELTHAPVNESLVAVLALGALTVINSFGVRAGSGLQNLLMVLKILAIITLVVCGFAFIDVPHPLLGQHWDQGLASQVPRGLAAAMVPVVFAYGGWQTSSFIAGEVRDPERNLPRALLLGVAGVVALYLGVNLVCLLVLGPDGLAASRAPASDVMRRVLGEAGVTLISIGIALSTLGFLSQGMLTAPRVYFSMATDGLFFKQIGRIHPRTHVPVLAIVLQGVFAMAIAVSGRYDQILNYVVSIDFIAFGLVGVCIFIFRGRDAGRSTSSGGFRVPWHPFSTLFFILACACIVFITFRKYTTNSMIGLAIVLAGIPAYFFWRRTAKKGALP